MYLIGKQRLDKNIDIKSSNLPVYETNEEYKVVLGSKISLEIFKCFPSLNAEAKAHDGMSMEIKSGGFILKNVDVSSFQNALIERLVDLYSMFLCFYLVFTY